MPFWRRKRKEKEIETAWKSFFKQYDYIFDHLDYAKDFYEQPFGRAITKFLMIKISTDRMIEAGLIPKAYLSIFLKGLSLEAYLQFLKSLGLEDKRYISFIICALLAEFLDREEFLDTIRELLKKDFLRALHGVFVDSFGVKMTVREDFIPTFCNYSQLNWTIVYNTSRFLRNKKKPPTESELRQYKKIIYETFPILKENPLKYSELAREHSRLDEALGALGFYGQKQLGVDLSEIGFYGLYLPHLEKCFRDVTEKCLSGVLFALEKVKPSLIFKDLVKIVKEIESLKKDRSTSFSMDL